MKIGHYRLGVDEFCDLNGEAGDVLECERQSQDDPSSAARLQQQNGDGKVAHAHVRNLPLGYKMYIFVCFLRNK